ncbi:prolyl oligopeptidase family serine peptidase [Phenylobacterium montanum]|uniref:prolyl oligopeptidase n=1 Tax=Phenylobacterium montanum TaxID=2823693 RepID=A0A975G1D5_9CAUL|nr:prolyl oligopeptidase family serine peptidase [Caulobacter sp. S6]QUD88763.1 S9 family peptidase [Caulobacter sp. S6]
MLGKLLRLTLAVALFAGPALADPADTVAVYTPVRPVTDTYHGVSVSDPYRWLEDGKDQQVVDWTAAENARTRATLDALKTREPIKRELTRLIGASSPSWSDLQARGSYVFALYNDPARQQPSLVTLNAAADPASRRTLLDPNLIDPTGLTAIDWFVASPDGRYVAVSLSKGGSEDGTLHIYVAATGAEAGEPIPRVQYPTGGGSLAWTRDGRGFWYTRYPGEEAPPAERHFNMQVYFHLLGADWRGDALALGARDGLERVSEVFLDNRYAQGEALASVQRGDGGQWAHYVLRPGQPPLQVSAYADRIVYATIGPDDALYAVSRAGALNGKVVKLGGVSTLRPGASLATAPVIVPESDAAILTDGAAFGRPDLTLDARHLIVRDIIGGPNRLRVFDHQGRLLYTLPLPEVAANGEAEPLANHDVLYDVSTYLRPRYFLRWTPATGRVVEAGLAGPSPIDFSDIEVIRAEATSADGTKVPLSIIRRKGQPQNGKAPALLYGYGGFGLSQSPSFLGAMRRIWLDAGGVYAVANIRGGAEFGERWHQDGMLTRKQNVFNDFAAAGDYLVKAGYASHDKLAIMGGSNGGLLMGATLTQRPDLAHAVVSSVGIYDMLRLEQDPNGAFNVSEYGSIADPEQFKALYAYSPYQHVRMGTGYPAVLLMAGANDGRVNPMQSRKFAAILQAQSGSGLPVLLRTSATSGHGIGSAEAERIEQQTDELAFLFDQLNVGYPPGTPVAQPFTPPPLPKLPHRRRTHHHAAAAAKPAAPPAKPGAPAAQPTKKITTTPLPPAKKPAAPK